MTRASKKYLRTQFSKHFLHLPLETKSIIRIDEQIDEYSCDSNTEPRT